MRLDNLRRDDSAVSPVIGVILMVAITVILAAVIATFVLGLGDQIQSNSPQASFSADYDQTPGELTISHDNGDTIQRDELSVEGNSGSIENPWSDTEVTAGDSITVEADPGDTVTLVWENPNGGNTATLYTWEG